ncbi:hypothetical protein BDQ17DRAFT_1365370 [Cyathus striatus]|nr:hypothetical protein BDQ17DRAFT_1365370 [Cyathus striatus]
MPEPPKPKPFSTAQRNPPTRYEASMFKGANVDNLEFENLSNVGMADLSGLDLSPEDAAKLFEGIMATNNEYAGSMIATMFSGVQGKDIKIGNALNVAGAAFCHRKKDGL